MDITLDLVRKAKSGNEDAFAQLYNNYSAAIYGVILKMVNYSEEVAADLLQDVFVKAWLSIDKYDEDKGRFYTWIYRITRNTVINYLRKNRPENHLADFDVYTRDTPTKSLNVDVIDLKSKIDKLDTKYREVVEYIYLYGYTHEEAQKQLNVPLGTIKTRLRKALQLLAQEYE